MIGREKNENTDDIIPFEIPGDGEDETDVMTYEQAQILDTPFFAASLDLYLNWAVFKILPHGKGTMHERQSVIEILRILNSEDNKYQSWDMKRDKSVS